MITLGAGPQNVVGGVGDTIIGGSGPDVIDGSAGSVSIIGGSGATTIYGGVGDTIFAGSGNTYIDGTAGGMAIAIGSGGTDIIVGSTVSGGGDTLTGGAAVANIQSLGPGDVVSFAGQTGAATINATAGNIKVTLGSGPATVYGGVGDTINFGSVSQYADGTAGKQTIAVGSGGTDIIVGSTVSGGGDTLTGGAGVADIQSLGKGDVVNFAAQTGNATINATAGNIAVKRWAAERRRFTAGSATRSVSVRSASTPTGRRASKRSPSGRAGPTSSSGRRCPAAATR